MFTADQLKELEAKLDSSAVKQREQAGRKFSYIEGWHAIAEANRIFGFDAWSRETVELIELGTPWQNDKSNWVVAYRAKVRITVGNVVREGCGFGSGIDRDPGRAHESAIKEAETDAMKRALMTFGNPFGLALYDKAQEGVEKAPSGGQRNGASRRPEPPQSQETTSSIQVADNAADRKADALIAQINGLRTPEELDELKADPDYRTLYARLSPSKQALVLQAGRRKAQSFAPPVMAG